MSVGNAGKWLWAQQYDRNTGSMTSVHVCVLRMLAMLGNGYELNTMTEMLKIRCLCSGCPVAKEHKIVKKCAAVKPLEEVVVRSYSATVDVRNLRGRFRVYEDSYGLSSCRGAT